MSGAGNIELIHSLVTTAYGAYGNNNPTHFPALAASLAQNIPAAEFESQPRRLESKHANMSSSADARVRFRELHRDRDSLFHQQALSLFIQQSSLVSHNHLVRAQGDCGADTLALLINGPLLTGVQWQTQRGFLSQAQRLYLATWLMQNGDTGLPGHPDLTFGQIYRDVPDNNPSETWHEFCTRMKLNGQYVQSAVSSKKCPLSSFMTCCAWILWKPVNP